MEIEWTGYRLIFIDVDGVLNRSRDGDTEESFVPELIGRFAALVRETGATLVLSSAWRLSKLGRRGVEAAFLAYGLPPPINCTPRMHGPRGNEVIGWLLQNTLNVFQDEPLEPKHRFLEYEQFSQRHYTLPVAIKVAQFVAIDDRDFRTREHGGHYRALLTQRGHFVHVDWRRGFSEENARETLRLLRGQELLHESPTKELAPARGRCHYCEKRVKASQGVHDEKTGELFCNLECLYRYRGVTRL